MLGFTLNQLSIQNAFETNQLPLGMMIQASPATNRFPIVQKAAIKLNIEPRLDFG